MVYRWFMGIFYASLKTNLFLSRKIVIINSTTLYSWSAVWFLDIWIIPSGGKIYALLTIFLFSENSKKPMLKKMPNYVLKKFLHINTPYLIKISDFTLTHIFFFFFSKRKTILWFFYSESFKSFSLVIGWEVLFPSFFKWNFLSLMIVEKIL